MPARASQGTERASVGRVWAGAQQSAARAACTRARARKATGAHKRRARARAHAARRSVTHARTTHVWRSAAARRTRAARQRRSGLWPRRANPRSRRAPPRLWPRSRPAARARCCRRGTRPPRRRRLKRAPICERWARCARRTGARRAAALRRRLHQELHACAAVGGRERRSVRVARPWGQGKAFRQSGARLRTLASCASMSAQRAPHCACRAGVASKCDTASVARRATGGTTTRRPCLAIHASPARAAHPRAAPCRRCSPAHARRLKSEAAHPRARATAWRAPRAPRAHRLKGTIVTGRGQWRPGEAL